MSVPPLARPRIKKHNQKNGKPNRFLLHLVLAVAGLAAFSRFEPQVTTFLSTTPKETLAIMGLALLLIPMELTRAAPKKKKKED